MRRLRFQQVPAIPGLPCQSSAIASFFSDLPPSGRLDWGGRKMRALQLRSKQGLICWVDQEGPHLALCPPGRVQLTWRICQVTLPIRSLPGVALARHLAGRGMRREGVPWLTGVSHSVSLQQEVFPLSRAFLPQCAQPVIVTINHSELCRTS